MSLLLSVSLVACSNESTTVEPSDTTSSENNTPSDANVLVVYYSNTSNTENIANYIAELVQADLYEIEAAQEYTRDDLDWTDDDSRVSRENVDESLRDVELVSYTLENWEDYDVIFIGYPIWWGIAAWPVSSFVSHNYFEGKTVIPFCTSSSSALGESGDLLAETATGGNWLDGERFGGSSSIDDVESWLNTLDF